MAHLSLCGYYAPSPGGGTTRSAEASFHAEVHSLVVNTHTLIPLYCLTAAEVTFLMFGRELAMPVDLMYPFARETPPETHHEDMKKLKQKLHYA